MQPNHRGARRVFQDGREELSQVKPWAPAPPQPLLQPENSARKASFRQAQQTQHFFCSLTLNLIFLARVRQTGMGGSFASKSK
jgi:hypothetical protein